jgi:hypothetical protein
MEWFASLFASTLFDEALSIKGVNFSERVNWLRVSHFDMIAQTKALDGSKLGTGVTQFGNRKQPRGMRPFQQESDDSRRLCYTNNYRINQPRSRCHVLAPDSNIVRP